MHGKHDIPTRIKTIPEYGKIKIPLQTEHYTDNPWYIRIGS